jgi:putative DNA methylase
MLDYLVQAVEVASVSTRPAIVSRGSATALPVADSMLDAVITDPPYYDNIPYADISDFFYVWLKRSLGHWHREHFAGEGTPKKQEAVADASRHDGSDDKARRTYERMMSNALSEAHRALKPGGQLVIVYAHKTTLGWATLVEALRGAGFIVNEAWPLDTEMRSRLRGMDSAALASSIFLIARKRGLSSKAGNYETDVVPELGNIVRERVETLWEMGISGADLVIASVGAGLRAFTKYARVEYGNGEEVAAERFLAEVETVVLETILSKLSRTLGSKNGQTSLAGLDPATRFYVLWRYTYGAAELEAGEAIIFANGTHVELEGQHSLTQGNRALLEKKKSKYRLHDYTERGKENALGQPGEDGTSAPAVDALHRLLWLLEHKPLKIPEFLNEAKPNVEQLRLVAQALGGPALSGGELSDVSSTAEQSALGKLLANWSAVMVGKAAVEDRRTGQQALFKA